MQRRPLIFPRPGFLFYYFSFWENVSLFCTCNKTKQSRFFSIPLFVLPISEKDPHVWQKKQSRMVKFRMLRHIYLGEKSPWQPPDSLLGLTELLILKQKYSYQIIITGNTKYEIKDTLKAFDDFKSKQQKWMK